MSKVIGELGTGTYRLYEHDRYIPIHTINMVDKNPTYLPQKIIYNDNGLDKFHYALNQRGILNCKIVHDIKDCIDNFQ